MNQNEWAHQKSAYCNQSWEPFPQRLLQGFSCNRYPPPPWWPLKGITWIGFASQSQRLHSSFTLWCKLARYKHHCCLVDFYFWGRLSPTATEDKEEFLIIIEKSLMWTWPEFPSVIIRDRFDENYMHRNINITTFFCLTEGMDEL